MFCFAFAYLEATSVEHVFARHDHSLQAFVQWLWNYLIYQRFVSEPEAQSFIDVCTVAKVSVLVLDAEYHGWYVHGDAAGATALREGDIVFVEAFRGGIRPNVESVGGS